MTVQLWKARAIDHDLGAARRLLHARISGDDHFRRPPRSQLGDQRARAGFERDQPHAAREESLATCSVHHAAVPRTPTDAANDHTIAAASAFGGSDSRRDLV